MRIVAGRLKGRPLASPRTQATRPTSDRLRQSLFNVLQHTYGLPSPETRVLDLFAGTGALGIEAISRGAKQAVFVETGAEARGLIRTNMENLGLTGVARILHRDATDLGPAGTIGGFGLVFADPPYGRGLGEAALLSARAGGWLEPGCLCILEERADAPVMLPASFEVLDRRESGDSQLLFLGLATAE